MEAHGLESDAQTRVSEGPPVHFEAFHRHVRALQEVAVAWDKVADRHPGTPMYVSPELEPHVEAFNELLERLPQPTHRLYLENRLDEDASVPLRTKEERAYMSSLPSNWRHLRIRVPHRARERPRMQRLRAAAHLLLDVIRGSADIDVKRCTRCKRFFWVALRTKKAAGRRRCFGCG